MGNFIDFLRDLSGDPDYTKKQAKKYEKSRKERFIIGGQSGFKWLNKSANTTWIENGKIVKDKKGRSIPK